MTHLILINFRPKSIYANFNFARLSEELRTELAARPDADALCGESWSAFMLANLLGHVVDDSTLYGEHEVQALLVSEIQVL